MNQLKKTLIISLILIPVVTLFYKSHFLGLQLVPQKASKLWRVELKINENAELIENQKIVLPVPQSTMRQKVSDLKIAISGVSKRPDEVNSGIYDYVSFEDANSLAGSLLSHQVTLKSVASDESNRSRLSKIEKSLFLSLDDYSPEEMTLLKKLDETLTFPSDSWEEKIKKYFYYLSDEISLKHGIHKVSDLVALSSGSYWAQSKALVGLARNIGIPARMTFGIKFLEPSPQDKFRYARVVATEIFMDGRWLLFLPQERVEGEIQYEKLITLCQKCGSVMGSLINSNILSILVTPAKFGSFSSEELIDQLSQISSFWSWVSLHRLPLSVQAIIMGIILVPIGTIAISFSRVLLGLETFGIFMPILLTLFFLETSFWFGFLFFGLVVVFGVAQRNLLDRFYLLSVPRLSILLSFTIILYLLFSVICWRFDILSNSQASLGYFPIVIITVFIEKLSVSLIEEGKVNSLKKALGTFVVSFLCYGLLAFSWLKTFLFNNPEVILISIGLNLLIGSYTGYRLSELFRFKDLKGLDDVKFS